MTIDPTDTTLFNLQFADAAGTVLETYLNLSVTDTEPRTSSGSSSRARTCSRSQAVPHQWSRPPARTNTTTVTTAGTDSGDLAAGDCQGSQANKTGIFALETADLFNLLSIPPDKRGEDTDPAVYATL